jgi:hypothetical protein
MVGRSKALAQDFVDAVRVATKEGVGIEPQAAEDRDRKIPSAPAGRASKPWFLRMNHKARCSRSISTTYSLTPACS